MQTLLQYIVIGLGAGAGYALFAQGAVLIYRGSGIVNFGHGAIGMVGAYIAFPELHRRHGWPTLPALLVGIAVAAGLSIGFQVIVLRALRNSAAILRVIATIGLLSLLESLVRHHYGSGVKLVDQFLPDRVFDWGGVKVPEERLYLMAIALAITIALWAWMKVTRVGLAIAASSENERAVRTLGWSPDRMGALTWGVGGALSAIAALLVAPLTGLSPQTFTVVVTVASLGAALLGGFRSFPLTLLGGCVVGVCETLTTGYHTDVERWFHLGRVTGMNRASAFAIILLVLVVRGRGLPLRSHVTERLPRLGSGHVGMSALLTGLVVTWVVLTFWFDHDWQVAAYTSMAMGVMILSIVVLTGFAGQISLAQWALGGFGALIAGRLVHMHSRLLPPEVCIALGIVLVIPIGLLFALPALRTRGVNLAVVTLGLGFTAYEVILNNARYWGSGREGGTRIGSVKLFGIRVDALGHPYRWALVSLIALVLTGLVAANLRRSATGRRLISVRTNERAAASLGTSVFAVKLYAFAVSAAIASLAGILVGFQQRTITYGKFNVFNSIDTLGFAVIGGLGSVMSAVFGSPFAASGLLSKVIAGVHLRSWDDAVAAALVLVVLMGQEDGLAAATSTVARRALGRTLRTARTAALDLPVAAAADPVRPRLLEVEGLTVRFGGVTAVDGVSFQVRPGEVVGLIGPNGAGKTTVIDAVTGFVRPAAGSLTLDFEEVNNWSTTRRARHGMRRSFQSLELFEDLTVEANLRAGADRATRLSWVTDLFWPRPAPIPAAAVAVIVEFGLHDELARLPSELPYGRRRLVGIARTVASGPSVIMLDEPAAGLDEVESRELVGLIRKLADHWRMGVLLVDHDMDLVMAAADRIVVLDFGAVIASGSPEEIRSDPRVRAAYLGI